MQNKGPMHIHIAQSYKIGNVKRITFYLIIKNNPPQFIDTFVNDAVMVDEYKYWIVFLCCR